MVMISPATASRVVHGTSNFGKLQYADDSGWLGAIEVARVGPITLNNQNTVATETFTRIELRFARTIETSRWRLEPFVAVSNALDEAYTANARINAFGSRFYEPGPDRAVFVGFEARLASGSR
ncbi:MAG: hypothetical protein AAFU66_05435 [Pseudomonadota bacterium]